MFFNGQGVLGWRIFKRGYIIEKSLRTTAPVHSPLMLHPATRCPSEILPGSMPTRSPVFLVRSLKLLHLSTQLFLFSIMCSPVSLTALFPQTVVKSSVNVSVCVPLCCSYCGVTPIPVNYLFPIAVCLSIRLYVRLVLITCSINVPLLHQSACGSVLGPSLPVLLPPIRYICNRLVLLWQKSWKILDVTGWTP